MSPDCPGDVYCGDVASVLRDTYRDTYRCGWKRRAWALSCLSTLRSTLIGYLLP